MYMYSSCLCWLFYEQVLWKSKTITCTHTHGQTPELHTNNEHFSFHCKWNEHANTLAGFHLEPEKKQTENERKKLCIRNSTMHASLQLKLFLTNYSKEAIETVAYLNLHIFFILFLTALRSFPFIDSDLLAAIWVF